MATQEPRPILNPAKLYLGDNGRCFCGACAGASAKYTGRDLSGQKVHTVTKTDRAYFVRDGFKITCESCGKE